MTKNLIVRGTNIEPDLNVFVAGDDNAIIAEVVYLDEHIKVIVSASSKRMDEDAYNERIGSHLAVGRALRDVGRAILKDGNELVKAEARIREEERILKEIRDEQRHKKAKQIKKDLKKASKKK